VTSLKADFDKLQTDVEQLKSDYLRSLAEFENFRRRKEKEAAELQEYANEKFLQELIPVLDNFERALAAAEPAETAPGAGDQGIRKGLQMIYGQLKETLASLGLEGYSCLGQAFDPRRCEAVGFIETDEHPEHTVVAETARGYLYKGKVLRPAMVTAAKESQKSEVGIQNSEGENGKSEAPGAETRDAKS
jgi:molecular chaperone GrpE